MRDAVEALAQADVVLIAPSASTGQVALSFHRQTLDQKAGSHLVVGRQHQPGVELFALQHVVLQHLAEHLQGFALVTVQRHHALVGLLARQAVLRVQGNGTAPLTVDVEQGLQPGVVGHLAPHRSRHPKTQVRARFGHGQLHGPIALHLQDERPVELDVGLHQHAGCRHLAQQAAHGRRVGALAALRRVPPGQQLAPAARQPHQHAAHGQPFKQELVQLAHGGQPMRRRPSRCRAALAM